jgi:hypothetical protein
MAVRRRCLASRGRCSNASRTPSDSRYVCPSIMSVCRSVRVILTLTLSLSLHVCVSVGSHLFVFFTAALAVARAGMAVSFVIGGDMQGSGRRQRPLGAARAQPGAPLVRHHAVHLGGRP